MAKKSANSYLQVTLTPFHVQKLDLISSRTGLSKSGVIQRLVEQFELKGIKDKDILEKMG